MNNSGSPKAKRNALKSILALAGGAAFSAATPGAADADIIVDSSLNGTVIGWNTGAGQTPSITTTSLPGGGGFTINTRATANGEGSATSSFVGVVAAWNGPGGGVFQRSGLGVNGAYLAPAGATVAAGSDPGAFANVNLGYSGTNSGNSAFSGSSKYLLFSFDNAGTTNYGWIELTATTTGFTGSQSAYSATLGDWAYDNSGATILAGERIAVPEPTSPAFLAMCGALVAGAHGLRRWRKGESLEATEAAC